MKIYHLNCTVKRSDNPEKCAKVSFSGKKFECKSCGIKYHACDAVRTYPDTPMDIFYSVIDDNGRYNEFAVGN